MTMDVRKGNMTPAELVAEQQRLGLTSREMARLLAVEPRTVNRWEAGERTIPKMVTVLLTQMTVKDVRKRLADYHEPAYIWPPSSSRKS